MKCPHCAATVSTDRGDKSDTATNQVPEQGARRTSPDLPAGTTRAGIMQTFAVRPIHRPRPTPEAGMFEVGWPAEPLPVTPGLQEGFESTLDQIDATLTQEAIGKLSLDATIFTANKPNTASDLDAETEADKAFRRFLGKVCIQESLEHSPRPETGVGSGLTLAQSIIEAKNGDMEAEARVDINIATAVYEACFKQGHITRIRKSVNDAGDIVQFGLTMEQVQNDSLVHRPHRPAPLKQFTLAEARNGLREQEFARKGVLDDAWFVAVSLVPQGMPEEWLDERGDGFFTRSMSFSLQGSTKHGVNEIVGETIFDSGTAASEDASFEVRQAERFDLKAYQQVCEWLGVPIPRTELEALESPLVIPKKIMPNGMLDFWRWMDIAADKIKGEVVERTAEEYVARDIASREREASLLEVQAQIKQELLAVERVFEHDIEANDLLWELVRRYAYKESATNDNIDPHVFGVKAAHKLRVARNLISIGDTEGADRWIDSGLGDASVSGCGGGACGLRELGANSPELARAKELLKFEDGDSVTVDEVRPCTKCGRSGNVVYVYNGNKVNKGCLDCGATEFSAQD